MCLLIVFSVLDSFWLHFIAMVCIQSGGEPKSDREVLRKSCFYNKIGAAAPKIVLEY